MLCGAIIVYAIWDGCVIVPDTGTYVHMAPHRSALYPLFLRCYFCFFSEETLRPLAFLQTALSVVAALFFVSSIRRCFCFKKMRFVEFFIFTLLMSPNFGTEPYSRCVMSEALAYPLWLLAASNIMLFFKERSVKACKNFFALTALLILTRRQFLFLYPVISLLLVGIFTYLRYMVRKECHWPLVAYAALSIVVTDLTERGYHLAVHKMYRHVPFTGQQLVILPFWHTMSSDLHLSDKKQNAIFHRAQNILSQRELPSKHIVGSLRYFYDYGIVGRILRESTEDVMQNENLWARDEVQTKMAFELLKHAPIACLCGYIKSILVAYIPLRGGTGGLAALWLSFLLLFFVTYRRAERDEKRLLECIAFMSASNIGLVALVEPILGRYTVYTDSFLATVLIAMVFSQTWPGKPILEARKSCNT
jgi:hypothetical protein